MRRIAGSADRDHATSAPAWLIYSRRRGTRSDSWPKPVLAIGGTAKLLIGPSRPSSSHLWAGLPAPPAKKLVKIGQDWGTLDQGALANDHPPVPRMLPTWVDVSLFWAKRIALAPMLMVNIHCKRHLNLRFPLVVTSASLWWIDLTQRGKQTDRREI